MGAAMRYQPQGLARLDRRNALLRGAQAVVSAAQRTNLVSQVALRTAGTVNITLTPAGKVFQFRQNGYVETEVLPAIGTGAFVEFWAGYPAAPLYAKGSGADPGFLTGSSANKFGICAALGQRQDLATAAQWGVVNNWDAGPSFYRSGEVLTTGVFTVLVVVRRTSGIELWRNGTLIQSFTGITPTNLPAESLILGSFVEDTSYWPSSSDTSLAGRIAGEWSTDQVKQFSTNLWQLFDAGSSSSAYQASIASVGAPSGGATSVAISGAWLEKNDSTALAASVSVAGSAAWAEQNDAAALSGSVGTAVAVTASWTESSDAASISAAASTTGAATWAEANDTLTATAAAQVSASATITEVNDGASIQSAVIVACSAALVEANDAVALSVSVGSAVAIIANWAESSDAASITASASITSSASWAEASDTAALAATVGSAVAANAQWIEASDATVISAQASIAASASWAEISDTVALAATAGNAVMATAALVEQSDGCTVLATVKVSASAGWAEASDLSGFSASVLASAGLAWVEASDILSGAARVTAPGAIPPVTLDASLIPKSRWVTFEGDVRVVTFEGTGRVVTFEGNDRTVRFE